MFKTPIFPLMGRVSLLLMVLIMISGCTEVTKVYVISDPGEEQAPDPGQPVPDPDPPAPVPDPPDPPAPGVLLLKFLVQPANANVGSPIQPSVTVAITDELGVIDSGFVGDVSIQLDSNPSGGVLGGTTTITASGGVAAFPDLQIDQVNSGYTLIASSPGLSDVSSDPFDVGPGSPAILSFSVQPSGTFTNQTIQPAVEVLVSDAFGNPTPTFTGTVDIALGTNPSGGVLSGTASVQASGGVAEYSDLAVDNPGNGYTLVATSTGLTSATSQPFDLYTGTEVGGVLSADTVWSLENSPYVITLSVLVEQGVCLTIEPGVEVRFAGFFLIAVEGKFVANGTPAKRITFTSHQAVPNRGDWAGIYFSGVSIPASYDEHGDYLEGSVLNCCDFQFGGSLRVNKASPLISNNRFRWNQYSGESPYFKMSDSTVHIYDSESRIYGNLIFDNQANGLSVGRSTGEVVDNVFVFNSYREGGRLEGRLGDGMTVFDGWSTVHHNVIANNNSESGGLHVSVHMGSIEQNSIVGNHCRSQATGAFRVHESNNLIRFNTIALNTGKGAIKLELKGSNFSLASNNIVNNGADYSIYFGGLHAPMDASNCFWGTTSESVILGDMSDVYDVFGQVTVEVNPISPVPVPEAPMIPPSNVSLVEGPDDVAIAWGGNPEPDLAGYIVYQGSAGFPYEGSIDVGVTLGHTLTGMLPGVYHIAVTAYDSGYFPGGDDPGTPVNESQTRGNESWYCGDLVAIVNGFGPDSDSDGISDEVEGLLGTDPDLEDTDNDTCPDEDEVRAGTDPLDPGSVPQVD